MKLKQVNWFMCAALMTSLLSACAKETAAVDSNGNCKQNVIDAYNDVNHKARLFVITEKQKELDAVAEACRNFQAVIGGQSCAAKNLSTGASTTISPSSHEGLCNLAR